VHFIRLYSNPDFLPEGCAPDEKCAYKVTALAGGTDKSGVHTK
jgi:hypothetical protein